MLNQQLIVKYSIFVKQQLIIARRKDLLKTYMLNL